MAAGVVQPPLFATGTTLPSNKATVCSCCGITLPTATEFRAHCKTDIHVHNLRRKNLGLGPLTEEQFAEKSRQPAEAERGRDHLKDKDSSRREGSPTRLPQQDPALTSPATFETVEECRAALVGSPPEEAVPFDPKHSLFDNRRYASVEDAVANMEKKYSFFIPDMEQVIDLPGLLMFLGRKLSAPPHACIACNRPFPNLASVRRHMLDKGHTRLGTEAFTRRGNFDALGTALLQAEVKVFYNQGGDDAEEVDDEQKAAALLQRFDADGDERLIHAELSALWQALGDGSEGLDEDAYVRLCMQGGAETGEGLDSAALLRLYAAGWADIHAHFSALSSEGECIPCEAESSAHVYECEDEEEFEEMMRTLGLVLVDVDESGDLRLPGGATAASRNGDGPGLRRRGRRLELALPGSTAGTRDAVRFGGGAGETRIAVSQQMSAESRIAQRQVFAVLRKTKHEEMRLARVPKHMPATNFQRGRVTSKASMNHSTKLGY